MALPRRKAFPTLSQPSLDCVTEKGEFVYVVMHSLCVEGASILPLETPIREKVASQYVAHADAPDHIVGANRLLWSWRKEKLRSLVLPVLKHIERGNYNTEIVEKLSRLSEIEGRGWDAIPGALKRLPPRHNCGVPESWCLAAIKVYATEMSYWWRELGDLRKQAAIWYLNSRHIPIVSDPAFPEGQRGLEDWSS